MYNNADFKMPTVGICLGPVYTQERAVYWALKLSDATVNHHPIDALTPYEQEAISTHFLHKKVVYQPALYTAYCYYSMFHPDCPHPRTLHLDPLTHNH